MNLENYGYGRASASKVCAQASVHFSSPGAGSFVEHNQHPWTTYRLHTLT